MARGVLIGRGLWFRNQHILLNPIVIPPATFLWELEGSTDVWALESSTDAWARETDTGAGDDVSQEILMMLVL